MKPKALFILEANRFDAVYGPDDRVALDQWADFPDRSFTPTEIKERPELLRDVELIFSSWGGPRLDAAFLQAVPQMRAFFYGAGSIRGIVTDAFWEKNIPISSAVKANAIPVAEFTVAQIVLSLKRAWQFAREMKQGRIYSEGGQIPGTYGATVGIVSMGTIGRLVREKLRSFDVEVLAYDPFLTAVQAAELEVKPCSLAEIFQRSDVVTLHAPHLPATEGLITSDLLESMKPNATLINTARGALIDEPGMISVLARRPDLLALLDVTRDEPLPPESPLRGLPNVILTPHIAGSYDLECRRMGRWMIEEARRFLNGEPLRWRVTQAEAAVAA
jgi:phosphoglycerate dehydrogenase-like enzyme